MLLDIEFHLVLARMCSNPLVLGVSKLVAERTEEVRIRSHATIEIRRACLAGHHEVYKVVVLGELDGAEHAMRRHLCEVHRHMRS